MRSADRDVLPFVSSAGRPGAKGSPTMSKSIKARRESEKACSRPINAPYSLRVELVREYPHSGDQPIDWASEWDEDGYPAKNGSQVLFAPLRVYCPAAFGETLDATMLLDKAQVDLEVPRDDLDKLTIYEFARLITLFLRWSGSQHEHQRARVRSEAERMRDARFAHPWMTGSKAIAERMRDVRIEHPWMGGTKPILEALEIFTDPQTKTAPPDHPSHRPTPINSDPNANPPATRKDDSAPGIPIEVIDKTIASIEHQSDALHTTANDTSSTSNLGSTEAAGPIIPLEFQTNPMSRSDTGKMLGLSKKSREARAGVDALVKSKQLRQMATKSREKWIYDWREINARLTAKNTTQHDATRRNTTR